MINNSIFRADAQVCYNLDVRVMHEHDRKRKMLKHDNIIEQSGRSMIEMLGVLAIVGVLSVGGIAGYSKAMTKFKINKTIDEVSHIVANIRTLYSQQTTYAGLWSSFQADDLIKTIIPDSINPNGMYNAFNGTVGIHSSYSDNHEAFAIRYTNLPKEACVALATHDWGTQQSSGLIAISIANGYACGPMDASLNNCNDEHVVLVACPGNPDKPTPINVASAAQACVCEEDGGCTIGWKFQ